MSLRNNTLSRTLIRPAGFVQLTSVTIRVDGIINRNSLYPVYSMRPTISQGSTVYSVSITVIYRPCYPAAAYSVVRSYKSDPDISTAAPVISARSRSTRPRRSDLCHLLESLVEGGLLAGSVLTTDLKRSVDPQTRLTTRCYSPVTVAVACERTTLSINTTPNKLSPPRRAQTYALPLFCDRDLEINPVTLKLKDDVDILKMYLHAGNNAATLKHSTVRAGVENNTKMSQSHRSRLKGQKLQITSSIPIKFQ